MFIASSTRKFTPASPINIYKTMLFPKFIAAAHSLIVGIKKRRQPIKNIPVFASGQIIAATATAT